MTSFCAKKKTNEFRAVQKIADRVELEKCRKKEPTLAIRNVDTTMLKK